MEAVGGLALQSPESAMLIPNQKHLAVDNDSFNVRQRAFDGARWSMGISRRPREGEVNDISETRDAIALTVLRCASAGARDVQALKVSALRCLLGKATRKTMSAITASKQVQLLTQPWRVRELPSYVHVLTRKRAEPRAVGANKDQCSQPAPRPARCISAKRSSSSVWFPTHIIPWCWVTVRTDNVR
jgi:hypothetical protein